MKSSFDSFEIKDNVLDLEGFKDLYFCLHFFLTLDNSKIVRKNIGGHKKKVKNINKSV